LVFDLETNSKDAFEAEIIDGCFAITDSKFNIIDSHRMLSQVDKWNEDAADVHGISYKDTLAFPTKNQAYHDLFKWLSQHKPYKVCCYSNPNSFGNYFHYDLAVIKMQMNILFNNHVLYYQYFSDKPHSPYLLIKELHKNKIINIAPHESLSQFSMENVYINIFNESYNAHKSVDDVNALLKICKYIDSIKHENNLLFNAIAY
jgi:inhibitor of KinA sporulation pathway (predicted exonuclease)